MTCIWKRHLEDTEIWETACGDMHEFTDGDPSDNNYRFCPYCGKELRMWHAYTEEELRSKLVVGARIRMGRYFCSYGDRFHPGEEITLIQGVFDHDNGLYCEQVTAPAILSDESNSDPYDSIYHLFGNRLENFYDCEVL